MKQYHKLSNHKLYHVWTDMKQRCYNKNSLDYKWYGQRGIKVSIRWRHNFKAFYNWAMNNGYGEGLQIDRKDNDKNYKPGNCRFVTPSKNQINKNLQSNNTSGYKGVYYNKPAGKFLARANINNKRKHIGLFKTAKQAHEARIKFLKFHKIIK